MIFSISYFSQWISILNVRCSIYEPLFGSNPACVNCEADCSISSFWGYYMWKVIKDTKLNSRVRPYILTYTSPWVDHGEHFLSEIGRRASSQMNIHSLGMNHLISQERKTRQHREFHRNQIWPIAHPLHDILNASVQPQMNKFKFIFARNSRKFQRMNMTVSPEGDPPMTQKLSRW